jgi:hypothetical protein
MTFSRRLTPVPPRAGAGSRVAPNSLRVAFRFVAIFVVVEIALLAAGAAGMLCPLTFLTAKVTGGCLVVTGMPLSVRGDSI